MKSRNNGEKAHHARNTALVMTRLAEASRCPKCQRKSGLKSIKHLIVHSVTVGVVCRWCGYLEEWIK